MANEHLTFSYNRAKDIVAKYQWFMFTNFAKYIRSVGIGEEGIIIGVSEEYMGDKLSGQLLPSDKFFELFGLWKSAEGRYYYDPKGFKEYVLNLTGSTEMASGKIEFPKEIEGIPVKEELKGRVELLYAPLEEVSQEVMQYRQYSRPFYGGQSIAHINITAGTFTCIVWDKRTGKKVLLSNRHVFSPLTTGTLPTTRCIGDPKVGDLIVQPGPKDIVDQGGDPKDPKYIVGKLLRAAPYDSWWTGSLLKTDSAIAEVLDESLVSEEILGIGKVNGITEPEIGMHVRAVGRTSGYRESAIKEVDVWIPLCTCGDAYVPVILECCLPTPLIMCVVPGVEAKLMTDCFQLGPNSGYPGDSGSIIMSDDNKVVGQLFGGDSITHSAVCSKASNIESILDVSFTPYTPKPSPWPVILAALGLGIIGTGLWVFLRSIFKGVEEAKGAKGGRS